MQPARSSLRVVAALLVGAALAVSCSSLLHFSSDYSHKATRPESHSLQIARGDTLRLTVESGDVNVTTALGEAHVEALVTAWSESDEQAQQLLDERDFVIERSGNVVELRLDEEAFVGWREGRLEVDLEITIPAGVSVDVGSDNGTIEIHGEAGVVADVIARSGFGDVSVSGVEGDVDATSSAGRVVLAEVAGERVLAETSFGSVRVTGVQGDHVRVVSSSGKVTLHDATGGTLIARTSFGDVDVRRIEGNLTAETSSGSVTVEQAGSGELHLATDFGSIDVSGGAGSLKARSSSGRIDVDGFSGTLEAVTSYGRVDVAGRFDVVTASSSSGAVAVRAEAGSTMAADWDVSSDFGSVVITLPADLAFALQARTGWGAIDSDFDVLVAAGAHSDKRLSGSVNGGGPVLRVGASSGDVDIRKLSAGR